MINSEKMAKLLGEPLDKDIIAYREESWTGGQKMPYMRSHSIIEQANRIFGFDGWSYHIESLEKASESVIKGYDKNGNVREGTEICVQCRVKVSVNLTSSANPEIAQVTHLTREDVGYGTGIDYRSKATALESAGKEAVSDALKRAMRTFGDQFGNCLYDKDYRNTELGLSRAPTAQKSFGGKASGKPMSGEITANQKKFINKLIVEKGKNLEDLLPEGKTLDQLTKQEASEVIDKLNKG